MPRVTATVPITIPVTIASGESLSAAVAVVGMSLQRIVMPASWTTANVTVTCSEDNVTWADLYDASGVEYVIVAAANRTILLPPPDFLSIKWLKLRSGTAGTPVVQSGDRTLQIVARGI